MTRQTGGMIRAAATALVALVLAHSLIFLSGYGAYFGMAMGRTGHDLRWTIAVIVSLALGGSLFVAAALRLRQLRLLAAEMGVPHPPSEPNRRAFLLRWLMLWVALAFATAFLFVVQENVEQARVTQHLPGIGVLTSTAYPHAVAIIALVALAVSFVASLIGWRLDVLIACIGAGESNARAAAIRAFVPSDPTDRRPGSILGWRLAGRAPPVELAR